MLLVIPVADVRLSR